MSTELHDAIVVLERKRAEIMNTVKKYDDALKVLRDLDQEAAVPTSVSTPKSTAKSETAGPPSVMTKALRLLNEGPREWTVAEILDEYGRRDSPMEAKDPANATRTALSTLQKQGRIIRVRKGVYRNARRSRSDAPSGVHALMGEGTALGLPTSEHIPATGIAALQSPSPRRTG